MGVFEFTSQVVSPKLAKGSHSRHAPLEKPPVTQVSPLGLPAQTASLLQRRHAGWSFAIPQIGRKPSAAHPLRPLARPGSHARQRSVNSPAVTQVPPFGLPWQRLESPAQPTQVPEPGSQKGRSLLATQSPLLRQLTQRPAAPSPTQKGVLPAHTACPPQLQVRAPHWFAASASH